MPEPREPAGAFVLLDGIFCAAGSSQQVPRRAPAPLRGRDGGKVPRLPAPVTGRTDGPDGPRRPLSPPALRAGPRAGRGSFARPPCPSLPAASGRGGRRRAWPPPAPARRRAAPPPPGKPLRPHGAPRPRHLSRAEGAPAARRARPAAGPVLTPRRAVASRASSGWRRRGCGREEEKKKKKKPSHRGAPGEAELGCGAAPLRSRRPGAGARAGAARGGRRRPRPRAPRYFD